MTETLFNAPQTIPGQRCFDDLEHDAPSAVTVEHDLLGPRYVFTWSEDDTEGREEVCTFELYAGEWRSVKNTMGDDFCWHELSWPATLAEVIRMALGVSRPFRVEEVAGAQLDWAKRLGGRKGAGMRRSLDVQLGKHGLRVVV